MSNVDRRILKSQEAIKKAVIELMSEKSFDQITIQDISDRANVSRRTIYLHYLDKFDLLDKIIEEHINELRELAESASEMGFINGNLIWFEYFESHYLFFSTMLVSKGAPSFRRQFLEFVMEVLKGEVNLTEGKNHGINEEVFLRFIAGAYLEIVEWWFKNGMPCPPQIIAEQVGVLIERIVYLDKITTKNCEHNRR
ncbi:TetR/AcrR family transcriptional regulator [Neobacillus niacini]|uniref:TetR/AcrR family transcriptional regulator n=1 Tax=Neobacillus niacini TaxID=86668 RepID=UPI0005ED8A0F|nr:TetR/AcrR family transcriptional regulator [Neobacillus niacini]